MTLPVTSTLENILEDAADQGLDLAYIVVIDWGGQIGARYYTNRTLTMATPDGDSWEELLEDVQEISRRADVSAIRFDALNDDINVVLRNTPEDDTGAVDANRVQDILAQVTVVGADVQVGMVDVRGTTYADIKWDGVYKVDRVDISTKWVRLYCVDRLLQPGEKLIGETINNNDWPGAPESSYGVVRGPVFGKVESLPLVPVEVGLFATLAGEIDAQDGVIEIEAEELSLWPASGYAEVGDEVIHYQVIDRVNKTLGTSGSPVQRGTGFPNTTPATHTAGAIIREVFTGRSALLSVGLTPGSSTIEMLATDVFPDQGIVLIGDEAIYYYARAGNTLTGIMRGVPVPTMARVHDPGTPVRTIPVGPDGKPRYRYVVAQGDVAAVSNLRVMDDNSSGELPYTGGVAVPGQVTTDNGVVWSIVDLPARAKYQKYETSGSAVDQEWICETDGNLDPEGVALPGSFLRWRPGAGLSPAHWSTWPLAIDPNASTRAVILETAADKNVFSVEFDARWDSALNDPRRRFGRFRNARVRMRVQYDRATTTLAQFQVYTNGLLTKSGAIQPPTMAAGGDGTISGTQELPKSRWGTQPQTKEVRLASWTTNSISRPNSAFWVNPKSGFRTDASYDHNTITSGDVREFISGGWQFPASPGDLWYGGSSRPFERIIWDGQLTGTDAGPLYLYSSGAFPDATSTDRLRRLVLTIHNPTGEGQIFPPGGGPPVSWNDWVRTGWSGSITVYRNADFTGESRTFSIGIARSADVARPTDLSLEGLTWADCQSIRLRINQWQPAAGGEGAKGVSVGQIFLAVEYEPDIEGQRVGTLVDGSYFRTTDSTVPSRIFDQVVSLGATAKEAARTYGVDPWLFFSNILGEGMRFVVSLPPNDDPLQLAVADIVLELEYDAATVVYDGVVRADVDGRTGVPLTGGAPVVLENATDVLAYLVDQDEFYGLGGNRHSASWLEARELTELAGWRVARAITEPITVRELAASLASESRQWVLPDGLEIYCRARWEEASPGESIRTVGDQANPAYALVRDDVQVVNRIEDIANSLGCYYRRNYLTGDYRGVIEAKDDGSVELYGLRRATPNLDWHQSARGYVGGIHEQRERLHWLTDYMLTVSARRWDYATFELPASAVEDLQRYDVITLNRARSGYVDAVGRVVSLQRMAGPVRWQVTAQMSGMSAGGEDVYVWQSTTGAAYIKLVESGSRMDFFVDNDWRVAQLTHNGDLLLYEEVRLLKVASPFGLEPAHTDLIIELQKVGKHNPSGVWGYETPIRFALPSPGYSSGGVTIYADAWEGAGAMNPRMRDIVTRANIPNITGANGIVDTGVPGSSVGRLEFYVSNRLVMYIDDTGMFLRGDLRTNLTTKIDPKIRE